MTEFNYAALKMDGSKIRGVESAASKAALEVALENQGLLLVSASKARKRTQKTKKGLSLSRKKKITTDTLVLFTRQFSTMFRVGIPLLRILSLLKDQVDNYRLQMVVSTIAKDVEAGSTLADAFSRHPKVFPPIYCSMLAAGEASGNISVVMEKLCQSIEYESEVKSLIKGALQYPIIVFFALNIAFAVLMGFVVPAFLPLFDQLGGELPALTKVCVVISTVFTDYWYYLFGVIAVLVFAFISYNRTDAGKLAIARVVLKFPLTGALMNYSYMARFGSLFAILQSSGILIVNALQIVGKCINNRAIREEITEISKDVEAGKSIAVSLNKSIYFPKIMQSMISIGEVSGNLEEMMVEASRHYEVEVHHAVKRLTGALGPILIVVMAIAVGFFAMAIYLPIWQLTELQMDQ